MDDTRAIQGSASARLNPSCVGGHSDSPIREPEEDKLKRDPYAASIARMIHSYGPSDSAVVGLVGKWGSGKSSLINLVVKHLKALGHGIDPVVMRFNPWRYAGADYLFAGFFSALADEIGVGDKLQALREASKRLKRYGTVIGAFKVVPLKIGSALGSIGSFLQLGGASVEQLLQDAGTLEALHDDLVVELLKARTRILVIIDDIDRLAPTEILQIFQLIKSLADFPYVMYLIAYDESVVLRAIDEDESIAKKYLEKIVTFPIDVPRPHRSALDNMLLSAIFDSMKIAIPPYLDEERLLEAFTSGWRRYLETVRDVVRFLNAFDFNYARARDDVDIGDLAAITALQVFEHKLYDEMPKSPDVFVDTVEAIFRGDKSTPKENRERLEQVFSRAGLSNSDAALETLRQVFFKVDLAWKGHSYQLSLKDERAQHRACVADFFFKYFNMGVQPTELENDEYLRALQLSYRHDAALIGFLTERGTDKAMDFVDRIPDTAEIHNRDWNERVNLAASVFDIVENIEFPTMSDFMPSNWKIGHAINYALETNDPSLWVDGFLRAASMTSSIGYVIRQLHLDLALKKERKNRSVPELDQAQVATLQSAVVDRLEDALAKGQMTENRDLAAIVYALQDWGMSEAVESFRSALRTNPLMLLSFVISARQRPGFEGYLKPKPFGFDLGALESVLPISTIRRLLTSIDPLSLDEFQREAIRSFIDLSEASEKV